MASKHGGRSKIKCFQCGKIGHKKADCRVKVDDKNKKAKKKSDARQNANLGVNKDECVEDNPEIAFVASSEEEAVKIGWYLDSGATDHMLNDSSYFVSMKQLVPPVEIVVANGQKLLAEHSGDVVMHAVVDGKSKRCVAKDVLYLPGLSCNLFSVKRVTRSGFQVCFTKDKAQITRNGAILAVGWFKGKLYELDVYCNKSEMGSAMVTGKVSRNAVLWHQRYGHVGCDSLRKLVRHDMVDGLKLTEFDDSTVVCEPCLSGKIAKLPFTSSEDRRSSRPLELIHSDVCGPMTPHTWDGKRFFVSFIDDFSHFSMIFLISSKDQVLDCFRDYEALVTVRFGTRISRLRTDNGGEYVGEEMRAFCRKKGIAMERTVPYTPQQNGVSERMNRTLMERARAVLAESGFGKEMWGEAVYTATYLTNRCPTSAVGENKTPFELWTGRKPDVTKLRVFGSVAHTHIPKELRTKLDPKSKKLYMVGYTVNGYRLWDEAKQKVVIARDVVFDESSFFGSSSAKQGKTDDSSRQVEIDFQRQVRECSPVMAEPDSEPEDATSDDSEAEGAVGPAVPGVRRSGRTRREPQWFDCYEMSCGLALCAENFVDNVPNTVKELKERSDWPQWEAAIASEIDSLVKNKTWVLTALPEGRKAIDSRWVFKLKHGAEGNNRYKARLVARGFSQRRGFDYEDTYAPVARMTTLRVVLSVANFDGMRIHQLDVKTAFLNGNLDQDIYMRLPDEFATGGLVAKLQRSLYGLKQASRAWNSRFHVFMMGLGFQRSEADSCLYTAVQNGELVVLIIYVDDILIACRSLEVIAALKENLKREFEMTDLNEVKNFLGLSIEYDRVAGHLCINQKQYLEGLLNRFNMGDCKPVQTPIATGLKLEKCTDAAKETDKPYRQLIGCLMYVTTTSRPDICAAVNYFSGFQSCATDEQWSHLKRILRYIRGTLDLRLEFRRNGESSLLEGYVDADWAGDVCDRRSTSGFAFSVLGGLVSWATRKQTSVALSSAEAEYVALSVGATEVIWLRMLLRDLHRSVTEPTVIKEDNQACIRVAEEDKPTKRLKHVDVRWHFVKNEIQRGVIKLVYVPTDLQVADIMTKALPGPQFGKLRDMLGLSA